MLSFWGILWVAFACRSLFCSLGLRKAGLAEVVRMELVWRRNSCRTSWQNLSGYFFFCFCFLSRFRSALMGTGFVMAGFLRLSVHLRRSSSFIGLRTHWYGATLHGSAWLNHSWLNRRCYPVVRCMAAIYRMFVSLWRFQARFCLVIVFRIALYFRISEGGAISCPYCFLVGIY